MQVLSDESSGERESFVSSSKLSAVYFSLTLIINDMKRIFKKISKFKSKKPSLGSIHGPG